MQESFCKERDTVVYWPLEVILGTARCFVHKLLSRSCRWCHPKFETGHFAYTVDIALGVHCFLLPLQVHKHYLQCLIVYPFRYIYIVLYLFDIETKWIHITFVNTMLFFSLHTTCKYTEVCIHYTSNQEVSLDMFFPKAWTTEQRDDKVAWAAADGNQENAGFLPWFH